MKVAARLKRNEERGIDGLKFSMSRHFQIPTKEVQIIRGRKKKGYSGDQGSITERKRKLKGGGSNSSKRLLG